MSILSRNIQALMLQQNLSGRKLAKAAGGVGLSFVYDILSGKSRAPTLFRLQKVAAVLGTTAEDLCADRDTMNKLNKLDQDRMVARGKLEDTQEYQAREAALQAYMAALRAWEAATEEKLEAAQEYRAREAALQAYKAAFEKVEASPEYQAWRDASDAFWAAKRESEVYNG
jgi:transcriptional regulator with XRE-family HTH domain